MAIAYNAEKTRRSEQESPCVELDSSEHVSTQQGPILRCGEAKVYPVGYSLGEAAQYVEQLMQDPKMLFFDTRYTPFSWKASWTKEALQEKWGARYHWSGKFLGNENHKIKGASIKLANPDVGIPALVRYIREGYSLILVCGCADYHTCHRKVICGLLSEAMPEVQIVPQPQVVSVQKDTIPYRGQLKLFDVPRSALEIKPEVASVQPPMLFDTAIEKPVEQEATPEIDKSKPAAPVVVEESQPCCSCGATGEHQSPGGEHYCNDCYICWKCKMPPRWAIHPWWGTNVCQCVVDGIKWYEMREAKKAASKSRRKGK